MIGWMFDVDGVLCDTGCSITPEFKEWFIEWGQGKIIYLATGSQREKTIQQIGQEIVDMAVISFNCLGNSIWMYGKETRINQITLHQDELAWLQNIVNNSRCPSKTGFHIDLRPGSINFSTVGRNATMEQRLEYKQWDDIHKEREQIRLEFLKMFPRFDAYIGGNTSIDICLRGANKGQCRHLIPFPSLQDGIFFFGDKCGDGQIDEPLKAACCGNLDRTFEVNGYHDTWNLLKTL